MGGQLHGGFVHDAFVYRGDGELVSGTSDFVRAGVDAGEALLVAVTASRIGPLRDHLGSYGDEVRFVDISDVGRNPARIIPLWREALDAARAADRPLRGVGEPVYAGRTAAEIEEAQLHEALLNVAFAGADGFRLRCPYDADGLPGHVIAAVERSHPVVLADTDERPSTGFDPLEVATALFESGLPAPAITPECWSFDHPDLRPLREKVLGRALEHGLDRQRADDLTLSVHEICKNSIRFGGARGTVSLWSDGPAMVCEVHDAGRMADPMLGRVLPPVGQEGGRGLWLANQLCDLVQIRSSTLGTAIRLVMAR